MNPEIVWSLQIATTIGLLAGIILALIFGQPVKPFSLVTAAVCSVCVIKFNPLFKEIIEKLKKNQNK